MSKELELIENEFKKYLGKICTIQHYQRIINTITKSEIKSLSKIQDNLKDKPDEDKEFYGISLNLFTYRCPFSGHNKPYESLKTSVEEKASLILYHKNKQYQWLLVDAYEIFEDYVESLYACMGFIDNNFWPASDFGNISVSEIPSQDLNWFNKQSTIKKRAPKSILNIFRDRFGNLQKLERENATDHDLRLSTSLVENLRHIIVHKNGQITSKDEFIKKILSESCLQNDDKSKAKINNFIGAKGRYLNHVVLVEQIAFKSGGFSMHVNLHENLVGELSAYAELLKAEAIKYLQART